MPLDGTVHVLLLLPQCRNPAASGLGRWQQQMIVLWIAILSAQTLQLDFLPMGLLAPCEHEWPSRHGIPTNLVRFVPA